MQMGNLLQQLGDLRFRLSGLADEDAAGVSGFPAAADAAVARPTETEEGAGVGAASSRNDPATGLDDGLAAAGGAVGADSVAEAGGGAGDWAIAPGRTGELAGGFAGGAGRTVPAGAAGGVAAAAADGAEGAIAQGFAGGFVPKSAGRLDSGALAACFSTFWAASALAGVCAAGVLF